MMHVTLGEAKMRQRREAWPAVACIEVFRSSDGPIAKMTWAFLAWAREDRALRLLFERQLPDNSPVGGPRCGQSRTSGLA